MSQRSLSIWLGLLAIAVTLLAAGCGGGSDGTSNATGGEAEAAEATESPPPAEPGAEPTELSVGVPAGRVLVNGNGDTLYAFSRDQAESGTSACYGKCAKVWIPLATTGPPVIREGWDLPAELIGAIERSDGTEQGTYAGHPLYTYSGDLSGGVEGIGKESFGGSWSAVRPSGKLVETG
jgi:predicted lipoprotein with Yx(FWY)xxD motif